MKLTKEQLKDLTDFVDKVGFEGFDYACRNYPLEDTELYELICEPVVDAYAAFETLMTKYELDFS